MVEGSGSEAEEPSGSEYEVSEEEGDSEDDASLASEEESEASEDDDMSDASPAKVGGLVGWWVEVRKKARFQRHQRMMKCEPRKSGWVCGWGLGQQRGGLRLSPCAAAIAVCCYCLLLLQSAALPAAGLPHLVGPAPGCVGAGQEGKGRQQGGRTQASSQRRRQAGRWWRRWQQGGWHPSCRCQQCGPDAWRLCRRRPSVHAWWRHWRAGQHGGPAAAAVYGWKDAGQRGH